MARTPLISSNTSAGTSWNLSVFKGNDPGQRTHHSCQHHGETDNATVFICLLRRRDERWLQIFSSSSSQCITFHHRQIIYREGFLVLIPNRLANGQLYCYNLTLFNLLTPNDDYSGRTAPLTSKRCILYIYSTNIGTEYIKHGVYSTFFLLQNAVCFINLTYLVPVLFTVYI